MKNLNSTTELFVDYINGDDWCSGISVKTGDSGPLKTIESALARVTELRDMGCMQPVTIYLVCDEYIADKVIKIEKNMGSITFESYGDKKVKISAARRIDSFFDTEFNGVKCIAAKLDSDVIPSDVFVNSKRAELTRFPEKGYLYPLETGSKTVSFSDNSDWLITAEREELSKFRHLEDAVISFNHFWVDEHTAIKSFDSATGRIELAKMPRYSIYSGNRKDGATINSNAEYSTMEYYIENIPEMFKKPNQWYFDKEEKIIYYIPEEGQNKETLEIYMPCTDRIFDINADNVNFRNIEFCFTSSRYENKDIDEKTGKYFTCDNQSLCNAVGIVNFTNSKNCVIENCDFLHYGLYGITINNGCRNIYINKNKFDDCGAGGIKIAGSNEKDDDKNYTYGNTISNNAITNCGIRHAAGCGILLMHSFENKIMHNEIAYTFYTGISLGWVWGYLFSKTSDNLIEKNHIHHIGQGALSDLGGIYLLGPQANTFIRNNLIHDVSCRYYGGQAIYLDEGASYVTIENNICYNVYSASLNLHFGFMNICRNNIFEAGIRGASNHWRQELHIGTVESRNILISKNENPIYGVAGNNIVTDSFISDNNLLYSYADEKTPIYVKNGIKKYKDDATKEHELDKNSIIGDPCFADFENKDFTINENSVAKKIDFKNIEVNNIGIFEK